MPSDPFVSYTGAEETTTSIPANSLDSEHTYWFPMRVTYGRSLKVGEQLAEMEIEYFLPYDEKLEPHPEKYRILTTPLINNLIFVRSSKDKLVELKHSESILRHMRFITFIPESKKHKDMTPLERSAANRILIIPDSEMKQFIRTVNENTSRVTLIPFSETFKHIGHKIRIIQGPLAGTIGTLRRISGNKHVHVDCGNLITVQIDYMPKDMYERLD